MTLFLQKSWAFLKKNWRYVLAAVGTVTAIFLFRRDRMSLLTQLKEISESHKKEIKKIEEAHEEERKKNAEALKLLQKRLVDVQKQYEEAKVELDAKKKAEIEKLIKKHGNDPKALAEKLSEVTGFKIIFAE